MSKHQSPVSVLQSLLSKNRTYITALEYEIGMLKCEKFYADKRGQLAYEYELHNEIKALKKELANKVIEQRLFKKLIASMK